MWLLFAGGVVHIIIGLAVVPWISQVAPLPPQALPTWYYVGLLMIFGVSGVLLYVGGKTDRRAQLLAVVLLLFGTLFTERLVARALPLPSGAFDALASGVANVHLIAFESFVFWQFAWAFPQIQSALVPVWFPRVMGRVTALAGGVLAFGDLIARVFDPETSLGTVTVRLSPNTNRGWFWQVTSILIVPSLVLLVAKLRAATAGERRRLTWVIAGIVVGTFPMVVHVFLVTLAPAYGAFVSIPAHGRTVGIVLTAFSLVIPATAAYAVSIDHVLEVRFVIRRAVQYALARYTVLILMAALVAGLVTAAYGNRHRSLADIVRNSPGSVAALSLTAFIVVCRRRLIEAIDRHFFREQYDARRILVELVDRSQRARSTRELVTLITTEVDRALHLEHISLLIRDEDSNQLRDIEGRLRGLPADGPLGTLILGSHLPLDVDMSSDSSPLGRLPEVEREWLADASSRLIVPLFGSQERPLGMLALGDKRSELPFTPEDRKLMMAVAASAALALEQKLHSTSPDPDVASPSRSHTARQCVACGRVVGRQEALCHACGGSVKDALLPAVLGGKFEIERQIGAGGMGVVYRAHDLMLDRIVALKVLPRVVPRAAARLRREARAMAMMQHANLAVIHTMESWRGAPVLVLEYLAGGTLSDRIRFGALAIADVVDMGIVIADVLHHLHRAGCLHRDVKPSNIGYTENGVPKLLDFGLVQLFPQLAGVSSPTDSTRSAASVVASTPRVDPVQAPVDTGIQHFVGTPAYLSPEAAAMAPPSQAVDLWGLGLTLYEALTGRNPFAAPTVAETLSLVSRAVLPDPREARADCPQPLAAFLASALAKDPAHRQQSAAEFGNGLRTISVDRRSRAAP